MIKIATIDDFEPIAQMVYKFLETTRYFEMSTEDKMLAIIEDFLTAPNEEKIVLLEEDKGMIAGMVTPFIFGNLKVAAEVGWWVEPEHRKEGVGLNLLTAFEFWAKKVGCASVTMVSLDDELGKFYERNGYTLYERAYMKELKD